MGKTIKVLLIALLLLSAIAVPAFAQDKGDLQPIEEECLIMIYAKALHDYDCGPNWHIVMTGVTKENAAPNVTVDWENGATEIVPLEKVTGNVAHYSTNSNLSTRLESVSAQIFSDWDGQFNVSTGPCPSAVKLSSMVANTSFSPLAIVLLALVPFTAFLRRKSSG